MRISIPIHRNRRGNRAEKQINSVVHNRINTVFFMAVQNESPYAVHLFVCTNDRAGERKSCADDHGLLIKAAIKKAVDEKGWKGKVRVSASGCFGAMNCSVDAELPNSRFTYHPQTKVTFAPKYRTKKSLVSSTLFVVNATDSECACITDVFL